MKKFLATALLLSTLAVAAETKWPDVTVTDVDAEKVDPPVYQDEDGSDTIYLSGMILDQGNRKEWLRVSVRYETRPEWMDELTLEFYVLLTGDEEEETLFKGTVEYMDIPESRNHLAEMYLHFNTYARFHSHRSIKTAVIAKVGGKEISIDRRNSLNDRWWEKYEARTDRLLNRLDTPFHIVNVSKYEAQRRSSTPPTQAASQNSR